MTVIAYNDTSVVDRPWDGPGAEANIKTPVTAAASKLWTWYDGGAADPDGDGYPDAKSAYKLPHHEVDSNGNVGPANVSGVRNALARLEQTSGIPAGDKAGVRAHLQKHLDKFNAGKKSSIDEDLIRVTEVEGRTWAIRPDVLQRLATLDNLRLDDSFVDSYMDDIVAARPGADLKTAGGTAVIPLKGIITPTGGLLSMILGLGGGLSQFRSQLRDAVGNEDVHDIVLNIDSPGGLVDHVPETAAEIRAASKVKPVTAVANTLAASAAYWLASQAPTVAVTPSGEVGSIGVYQVHQDHSRRFEALGVKHTIIKAGKYKIEGNPYEPLSEEAQAAAEQAVQDYYKAFTRDVAMGRDVSVSDVRDGFGEGRTLTAKRAVDAGLADRVATLDSVVSALAREGGSRTTSRRSDESLTADDRRRWLDVRLAGAAVREEVPVSDA